VLAPAEHPRLPSAFGQGQLDQEWIELISRISKSIGQTLDQVLDRKEQRSPELEGLLDNGNKQEMHVNIPREKGQHVPACTYQIEPDHYVMAQVGSFAGDSPCDIYLILRPLGSPIQCWYMYLLEWDHSSARIKFKTLQRVP
jgi:hypothetical protein